MASFLARIACEHFAFGLLIPVYIVLLTEQLGLSLAQAGLAVSCTAAASFILEMPAGVLADKIKRKYLLLASSILHLFSFAALFLAEGISLALMSAILTGAAFALASGTEESYVHDFVKKEDSVSFEKKLSQVSITDEVATILGMLSSSFILLYFNYSTLLGVATLILGGAVFSAIFLLEAKNTTTTENSNSEHFIRKFNAKVSVFLVITFLFLAVLAESGRLLWQPQLLATGWTAVQLGYVFAIIKLGSIAGAYIAGEIKVKSLNAILLGGVVGAIGLSIFSLNLYLINLGGLALYLLAENFVRIHTTSFILSLPNLQKHKATALSLYSIVNNSYLSLSALLLGVVATSSLTGALLAVAVIKTFAAICLILTVTYISRHRSGQSFPSQY